MRKSVGVARLSIDSGYLLGNSRSFISPLRIAPCSNAFYLPPKKSKMSNANEIETKKRGRNHVESLCANLDLPMLCCCAFGAEMRPRKYVRKLSNGSKNKTEIRSKIST